MVTARSSAKAGLRESRRQSRDFRANVTWNKGLKMRRSTEAAPVAPAAHHGPADGDHRPTGLVALADYRSPSMPAEHVVRAVWRRIKQRLQSSEPAPVRSDRRLQRTTLKALDEVAKPPACGPLLDDFDAEVRAWLDEPGGTFHCVVVLPPCDSSDVIGTWAQERGHAVLCAPARDRAHALSVIPGAARNAASDAQGEGGAPQNDISFLVIPQLERWFLRQRNGLKAVGALLAELQQSERRCLIGCNSWAWAFLVRAAGAGLVLPSPRTFAAFDGKRLQAWFAEMAGHMGSGSVVFRLASSGADVLETKGNGALANNYLDELAARSHGIPWVAWHLWRSALRTGIDAVETQKTKGRADGRSKKVVGPEDECASDQEEAGSIPKNGAHGHERTFWITGAPDPDLPKHHEDNALLVLHALLIHGALGNDELLSVLPDATAAEVLPALLSAGFIERRNGRLAVLPVAYPAVRRVLLADGFPMGEL